MVYWVGELWENHWTAGCRRFKKRNSTTEKSLGDYVSQQDNVIFSRLMDAGKLLFGKVKEKELIGKWLRIKIEFFLHEN